MIDKINLGLIDLFPLEMLNICLLSAMLNGLVGYVRNKFETFVKPEEGVKGGAE